MSLKENENKKTFKIIGHDYVIEIDTWADCKYAPVVKKFSKTNQYKLQQYYEKRIVDNFLIWATDESQISTSIEDIIAFYKLSFEIKSKKFKAKCFKLLDEKVDECENNEKTFIQVKKIISEEIDFILDKCPEHLWKMNINQQYQILEESNKTIKDIKKLVSFIKEAINKNGEEATILLECIDCSKITSKELLKEIFEYSIRYKIIVPNLWINFPIRTDLFEMTTSSPLLFRLFLILLLGIFIFLSFYIFKVSNKQIEIMKMLDETKKDVKNLPKDVKNLPKDIEDIILSLKQTLETLLNSSLNLTKNSLKKELIENFQNEIGKIQNYLNNNSELNNTKQHPNFEEIKSIIINMNLKIDDQKKEIDIIYKKQNESLQNQENLLNLSLKVQKNIDKKIYINKGFIFTIVELCKSISMILLDILTSIILICLTIYEFVKLIILCIYGFVKLIILCVYGFVKMVCLCNYKFDKYILIFFCKSVLSASFYIGEIARLSNVNQ